MRHIVICGLPGSTIYCIPTLYLKRHDFRKKLLNIKCVFRFSLHCLSETFFILRRIEWDMIKMYIGLHVKCRLLLSSFNDTWSFSTDFTKIFKYPISWKSVQWEQSSSMRTGRSTVTTLIAIFRNAPKNRWVEIYARLLKTIEQPTSHLWVCG
jgi:hypothetical protein